ncbi:hypothetical protein [Falsiroseomonas bella]|uniref:hypothetical protein n=1 Tax=Falsiroseomonas bella TaxID=2184016 RepID=UPI0011B816DC|nr:hypothetical protein [Falsiroseomonas bella]
MDSTNVISPERAWTDQISKIWDLEGQKVEVQIIANLGLWTRRVDIASKPEHFLLVSLKGSTVTPSLSGKLIYDETDKRGWYTDSVEVEIYFDNPNGLIRVDDSPETSGMVCSATTTTSIDFNMGTGFFGETSTGNVSASGSISSSWTESLEDFRFVRVASDIKVHHVLQLSAVKGGVYNTPTDLIDPTQFFSDVFSGHLPGKLKELPARATSSIGLVSQALFKSSREMSGTRELRIEIKYHLSCVEKTFQGVRVLASPKMTTIAAQLYSPIDFGAVD